MTDEVVLSNLSADRPIEFLQEDLLGRGKFVMSLATAIRQWKGADSLVLGIYGPWGHGKTSIKNLILSLLTKAEDGPAVVEFNSWNWTGEDRIQGAFFEEIGVAIGQKVDSPDARALASKWKKYATRLTLGGTALENLRTAAEFAGVPWASLILGSLAKASQSAATASEQASSAYSADAKGLDQTVEELKKSLHAALAELKRPVLIVMDDIDRLTNEEIRLLFRLIKSNADFPNVIYLLLFDREVVETALTDVSGGDGRSYMEKIVQAGFDLPKVQQSDIDLALNGGLEALLEYEGVEDNFDADRWQNFYGDCLRPFFQSLRDVHRFLSTFSFELGLFYRNKTLDINFIDLIGLEVLRVFEPELYKAVAKGKETLIRTLFSHILGQNPDDIATEFSAMLKNVKEERRESVSTLLAELFPRIRWALKGQQQGEGFAGGWERELRVCHEGMFDRYFIMNLPKGEVPLSVLNAILAMTNRDDLVQTFEKLHNQGLLCSAIRRLEAYKKTLNPQHLKEFVMALLDIDEFIPYDPSSTFHMGVEASLNQIIYSSVLQLNEQSERSKLMLECLEDSKGVWLPVQFVSHVEPKHDEQDLDTVVLDGENLNKAKEVCLSKIRNSALEGIDGPKLSSCLVHWRNFAGIEEPKTWCNERVQNVAGALRILRAFFRKTYVPSDSGTVAQDVLELEALNKFTDLDVLEETLKSVVDANTEYEEYRTSYQAELNAFKQALAQQKTNKADD